MLLAGVAAALVIVPAFVSGQSGARNRLPNFEGIWNSATTTPLERPADLKDKAFFTPEEAARWDSEFARRNAEPEPGAPRSGTGTYNTVYREFGTRTVKTLRTSIITEPADGRIPALTPAAADVKRRRLEGLKKFENPEDLGLQDQCLAFLTGRAADAAVFLQQQLSDRADGRRDPRACGNDPRRADHSPRRPCRMRRRGSGPGSVIQSGDGKARRWSSTRPTSTTAAVSMETPAATSAGTATCTSSNAFDTSTPNTLLYQFEIDNPSAFTTAMEGRADADPVFRTDLRIRMSRRQLLACPTC